MPNKQLIIDIVKENAFEYLNQHADLSQSHVMATTNPFNINNLEGHQKFLLNLARVNDIKKINVFFKAVNEKLEIGGKFLGFVETYGVRKERLLHKYPKPFNYIYYFLDFILTRISPKIWLTKDLYFFLSKGKGQVLSKTETLGRLVFSGFDIQDVKDINGLLYFVVKKVGDPIKPASKPKYGFLIQLPRVGKNGKVIKVYKLRTMHAYSEYIQQYVFEQNNLAEGGKLKDDFRIPTYGAKLRKYWIDELPMLINLLKGEMKIIGVRPLSKHYMSLYDDELKALRIKTKPGLLPPFYVDMPKTLDEIIASEKKYLYAYLKNPLKTDFIYFIKIVQNIIFKGKRSA
jgi:lipopolysaccharide/colanic/teichoic acid biosynthesis glycosyltransferase